jgi:catechol 2,3-dioxygenase-like lactoylglutathione lyase family enzyme
MIVGLDHVTVEVADLKAATEDYVALLGRNPSVGTSHEVWFGLANMALRLREASSDRGLTTVVFSVGERDAALRLAQRRGLASEAGEMEIPGAPETARIVKIASRATFGPCVQLIERPTGHRHPVAVYTQGEMSAVSGLDHVVVKTPNPDRAVALYGGRLGLDLRLERSNPQWGTRLFFFRTGGVTVEISHALSEGVSSKPDAYRGLAWRVPDAVSAQARLAARGVNVSEVRTGRRAGSHVFTIRDRTGGVPTLMLGVSDERDRSG